MYSLTAFLIRLGITLRAYRESELVQGIEAHLQRVVLLKAMVDSTRTFATMSVRRALGPTDGQRACRSGFMVSPRGRLLRTQQHHRYRHRRRQGHCIISIFVVIVIVLGAVAMFVRGHGIRLLAMGEMRRTGLMPNIC